MGFINQGGKTIPDGIKNALPWILVVLGIIFLVIAVFFIDDSKFPKWNVFLMTSGNAILIGGVFSVFVKSNQFTTIFQKALENIIWTDEYLGNRKDLEQTWEKLTHLINESKFPDIKNDLNRIVLNNYLPKIRNYYYDSVIKDITVKSVDNGILQVTEHATLVIKQHSNAKYIDYHYRYTPSDGGSENIGIFLIDGNDKDIYSNHLQQQDQGGNDLNEGEFLLHLPPKENGEPYTIERTTVRQIPIDKDPFILSTYKTHVRYCQVTAKSEIDDIFIRFATVGTLGKFDDINKHDTSENIAKKYENLIFPKQGHMLMFIPKWRSLTNDN